MTAPDTVAPTVKPKVRQANTSTRSAAWRARIVGGEPRRNWVVEYGALRLTYSSRVDALNSAVALRLWGMILPLGLVGMHREVEP